MFFSNFSKIKNVTWVKTILKLLLLLQLLSVMIFESVHRVLGLRPKVSAEKTREVSNQARMHLSHLSPKFPIPGKTWNFSFISGSTAVVTIFTFGNA